jgi:hypothetical protein
VVKSALFSSLSDSGEREVVLLEGRMEGGVKRISMALGMEPATFRGRMEVMLSIGIWRCVMSVKREREMNAVFRISRSRGESGGKEREDED